MLSSAFLQFFPLSLLSPTPSSTTPASFHTPRPFSLPYSLVSSSSSHFSFVPSYHRRDFETDLSNRPHHIRHRTRCRRYKGAFPLVTLTHQTIESESKDKVRIDQQGSTGRFPPGPQIPWFIQSIKIVAQTRQFLTQCAAQFGDTFFLRLLGPRSPPVVFLSDPNSIEAIFNANPQKILMGKITHPFLPLCGPESVIMHDGKQHSRARKLLVPPLHGDRLAEYSQLIREITVDVISRGGHAAGANKTRATGGGTQGWKVGDRFTIRSYTSEISLEVILRVVLGLQPGSVYDSLRPKIEPYLEYVNSPFISTFFFFPFLQCNLGPWSPWGKFCRLRDEIDALLFEEISSRRKLGPHTLGNDVLSMLMSSKDEQGNTLSDGELRDQLITIILLGHDTTASANEWLFYWVHQNPTILEKLTSEVDQILLFHQQRQQEQAQLRQDLFTKLPYLDAVCKEALRLHPVALISQPRVVKETIQIESYIYQPGTVLVPCIHLAHEREETYSQHSVFEPQRFLDMDNKLNKYSYFPFGGGSRTCVGNALALFQMKIVLATIVHHYRLGVVPRGTIVPVRRGITFVPSSNFELEVLEKR